MKRPWTRCTDWSGASHTAPLRFAACFYPTHGGTLRCYILCELHLNEWLDVADDHPVMEPTELTFFEVPK